MSSMAFFSRKSTLHFRARLRLYPDRRRGRKCGSGLSLARRSKAYIFQTPVTPAANPNAQQGDPQGGSGQEQREFISRLGIQGVDVDGSGEGDSLHL